MMNTTNPELKHLYSLINHGAAIGKWDGTTETLTEGFYNEAVEHCKSGRCNAVTCNLLLPQIADPMMICIWKDGHIDSGSIEAISRCLAAR